MDQSGAFTRAGLLLGLGFGGFFDGIVLHQILQWHHMLTSAGYPPDSVANLQVNTLADGLFHALTWVLTLAGVIVLARGVQAALREPAAQRESAARGKAAARGGPGVRQGGARAMAHLLPLLLATMLAGWGLFNLVEGLVDHILLQIHHVRDDLPPGPGQVAWDIGFLLWGAVMAAAGWAWARAIRRRAS